MSSQDPSHCWKPLSDIRRGSTDNILKRRHMTIYSRQTFPTVKAVSTAWKFIVSSEITKHTFYLFLNILFICQALWKTLVTGTWIFLLKILLFENVYMNIKVLEEPKMSLTVSQSSMKPSEIPYSQKYLKENKMVLKNQVQN